MSMKLQYKIGKHIVKYYPESNYAHIITKGTLSHSEVLAIIFDIINIKKHHFEKPLINLIIDLNLIECNQDYLLYRQAIGEFIQGKYINKVAIYKKLNHLILANFINLIQVYLAHRIEGNGKLKTFIFLCEAKSWIMKAESINDFESISYKRYI